MIRLRLRRQCYAAGTVGLLVASVHAATAATIAVRTNVLGPTPAVIGYNSGHFYPGSNTAEWWRYSGVNGARVFISPSAIEPEDDLPPWGDGVTNVASFLARRNALRADPLNTNLIDWPYFEANYARVESRQLVFSAALQAYNELGLAICAQITAGQSRFPIADADDWAGQWELWQHYYAQAFFLGRRYGVERYQMYNEPNHSNAGGLTIPDYLRRLQLASDAIQCALADVNRIEGTSLTPRLLAPVTAGSASSSFAEWGQAVIANRHRNFLAQTDPNFWLLHVYDYHQYNSRPASFGSSLAELRRQLSAALAPEPMLPIAISEFNVHTAANFASMADTLDTPSKFARFGAIVVQLVEQGCSELYAFKFSRTPYNGGVKKNGMHYVENDRAPYDIGGVTQAGEVWRLFAKGFASGRERLACLKGAGAEMLDVLAGFDRAARTYHVFLVNNNEATTTVTLDLRALGLPENIEVWAAEVSASHRGDGVVWQTMEQASLLDMTLPAYSVRLCTMPARPLNPVETLPATDDAMVKDGVNRDRNYGASRVLWVKNNSTNANARNVTFLKFRLPAFHPPDLQFAVLRLHAASLHGAEAVFAHVYGLTNRAWRQEQITWSTAPNLAQGIPASADCADHFVTGVGSSARLLGQVQAGPSLRECLIDVTSFVREFPGREITVLLARETRFDGDAQDADGLEIISLEGDPDRSPRLDLVRLKDTDGDGLSDEAETSEFHSDPGIRDSDNDGMTDGEEVFAGTDPTDARSVLRIEPPSMLPGHRLQLRWPTASNRTYRLWQTTNLTEQAWEAGQPVQGTGSVLRWNNTSAEANAAFFRVQVEP